MIPATFKQFEQTLRRIAEHRRSMKRDNRANKKEEDDDIELPVPKSIEKEMAAEEDPEEDI